MSEHLDQDNLTPTEKPAEDQGQSKKELRSLFKSAKILLSDLLDIRTNTDIEAAKEAIIADIPFKGHTAWILICSIFIASVGLNTNSPAVIIGAMLISPLMGPILGIGMSVAINDIDTLRRSLKNFMVMVIISVLTAFLFFYTFPLRDESSELLARTAPDIRDVLIAFFGGLALAIARTKKGTIASVIFGVAIATALMPPLCTVGFGLAIGNFKFAWGALFLFTINTIFIALATFLMIKLLRFPVVKYINSKRRHMISRLASVLAVLIMVPAGITFYRVFQESRFKDQAQKFINTSVLHSKYAEEGRFLEDFTDIEYNKGIHPSIELVFMGNETIPQSIIDTWTSQKDEYSKLKNCDLRIIQGTQNERVDQLKYIDALYQSQKNELLDKDSKIQLLEAEVARLMKSEAKQIPFKEISEEAKINYANLLSLAFSYTLETDFEKFDTIPIFDVKWKHGTTKKQIEIDSRKLTDWLRLRLKDSTIQLHEQAD
jgi:uncharacterized hydrophobic protein (TIGR00271 family)